MFAYEHFRLGEEFESIELLSSVVTVRTSQRLLTFDATTRTWVADVLSGHVR